MFRIALPVSHLTAEDSPQLQRLIDSADLLEYGRTDAPRSGPGKPAVFHWGLGTASDDFWPEFQRQDLAALFDRIGARLFSFDLGPACARNDHALPLTETLSADEVIERSRRVLDRVRQETDVPLAAENYNYYPTGLYDRICEPDFINRYVEELDVGLVLDLAHAKVSADNLGLNLMAYLTELPLGRVLEVHLSRPRPLTHLTVDAHDPPQSEDFDLLDAVLQSLSADRDVSVVVECYQDLDTVTAAHDELARRLGRLNRDLARTDGGG